MGIIFRSLLATMLVLMFAGNAMAGDALQTHSDTHAAGKPTPTPGPVVVPPAVGPLDWDKAPKDGCSAAPLQLGGCLVLRATGDVETSIEKATAGAGGGQNGLTLVLNGVSMEHLPVTWSGCASEPAYLCIRFDLIRNANDDTERAAWDDLLGKAWGGELILQPRLAVGGAVPLWVSGTPLFQVASGWRIVGAVIVFLFFVGLGLYVSVKSPTMLRNPGTSVFSLGRAQMAYWGFLVAACFCGVFSLTLNTEHIPPQVLILMGISAATGLAAVVIGTGDDVKSLQQAKSASDWVLAGMLAPRQADSNPIADARTSARNAMAQTMFGRANDAAQIANAQGAADAAMSKLLMAGPDDQKLLDAAYADAQAKAEALASVTVSRGFFFDICNDGNGISFHRVQVAMWTLVLGAVFVIGVSRVMSMPEFQITLLTLMGISNATYLGYKTQGQ